MAKIKTTTTIEYSVAEFASILAGAIYPDKDVKVEFVIGKIETDSQDMDPGYDAVTAVKVIYDGVPPDSQQVSSECLSTVEFWSKIHMTLNAAELEAFNQWRESLLRCGYAVRAESSRMSASIAFSQHAAELMTIIAGIPRLVAR